MSDLCRVFLVGNIRQDLQRQVREDGIWYGSSTICVGRTTLIGGRPVTETVHIPVEVIGAARVASVAQQFGAGSRVLVEGHLEERQPDAREHISSSDSSRHMPQSKLVLVIDAIFNASAPIPATEAQQQPARVFWQEGK